MRDQHRSPWWDCLWFVRSLCVPSFAVRQRSGNNGRACNAGFAGLARSFPTGLVRWGGYCARCRNTCLQWLHRRQVSPAPMECGNCRSYSIDNQPFRKGLMPLAGPGNRIEPNQCAATGRLCVQEIPDARNGRHEPSSRLDRSAARNQAFARSDLGSYIGFSDASARTRVPATSIS